MTSYPKMREPLRTDFPAGEEGFILWTLKRKEWLSWTDRYDRWMPFISTHSESAWFPYCPITLVKPTKRKDRK